MTPIPFPTGPGQAVKTVYGYGRIEHEKPDGTADVRLTDGKLVNVHKDFVSYIGTKKG